MHLPSSALAGWLELAAAASAPQLPSCFAAQPSSEPSVSLHASSVQHASTDAWHREATQAPHADSAPEKRHVFPKVGSDTRRMHPVKSSRLSALRTILPAACMRSAGVYPDNVASCPPLR